MRPISSSQTAHAFSKKHMSHTYRPTGTYQPDQTQPDRMLKKSIILCSFVGLAGVLYLFGTGQMQSILGQNEPDPQKEAVLVRTLLDGLNRHFQPKAIDDVFSKSVYKLYLDDLDNGKRFFTKEDVTAFEAHEVMLDDQAKAGTFEFFDLSVDRYTASLNKTQAWYRDILSKPMDFTANETIEMDGKKVKWAENDAALRRRWEQTLKYEVLSRSIDEEVKQDKADFKGEKKTWATLEKEAREKLLDNYDKWYKRLYKMDRNRRMELYLNSFTAYFDPHTGYYSPKQKENFDIQMSGKLEGIGARLQSDGDKTTVTEIVAGGPAWKQGELTAKDVVLKVAQGKTDEPVDVMGFDIDDVVSKIRGPKGTIVRLTVQKVDGTIKEIVITRDVVIMEEGFAKSLLINSADQADSKIGYIYLPKFYQDFTPQGATSCYEDVKKEVAKLKKEGVRGIVLDLRDNGGGSLNDVVKMSGLFIERGPIVQVKSRNRKPDVMEDQDPTVQWDGALIVMVNSFSASASEILAAAMQDYGRAVIVGSSGTYGKGTVQRFLDLDQVAAGNEGLKPLGEMKMTVQKFYRINGKTTQLEGVVPDIVLPDSYNLLKNGERETDYPLEANTIEPVPFKQNAYQLPNLATLRSNSEARVKSDPVFGLINDNAMRLRKSRDESAYLLQIDKYRTWNKKQDEEAARYDNMFKPLDALVINNLSADMAYIQADTARMARNTDWLGDKKKDIQLLETLRIMQDMIRMNGTTAEK
jgi:carboxyl-terminal processing protease